MPGDDHPRGPGRPRTHASADARGAAYRRRLAGRGLVRVSVMVPASRQPDILAIAVAMRSLRSPAAEARPRAGPYPMAGKPWRRSDDTILRLVWRDGGTAAELAHAWRVSNEAKRPGGRDHPGLIAPVPDTSAAAAPTLF